MRCVIVGDSADFVDAARRLLEHDGIMGTVPPGSCCTILPPISRIDAGTTASGCETGKPGRPAVGGPTRAVSMPSRIINIRLLAGARHAAWPAWPDDIKGLHLDICEN
jgi:hypothetical protein